MEGNVTGRRKRGWVKKCSVLKERRELSAASGVPEDPKASCALGMSWTIEFSRGERSMIRIRGGVNSKSTKRERRGGSNIVWEACWGGRGLGAR